MHKQRRHFGFTCSRSEEQTISTGRLALHIHVEHTLDNKNMKKVAIQKSCGKSVGDEIHVYLSSGTRQIRFDF
jgi:tRNA threonylcarbamoyladenosine modification (KEOPS) complex Cgi121 subunit